MAAMMAVRWALKMVWGPAVDLFSAKDLQSIEKMVAHSGTSWVDKSETEKELWMAEKRAFQWEIELGDNQVGHWDA